MQMQAALPDFFRPEAAQPIADVAHVEERHRGFFFPPNNPLLGSRFVPLVSRLSILLRNANAESHR